MDRADLARDRRNEAEAVNVPPRSLQALSSPKLQVSGVVGGPSPEAVCAFRPIINLFRTARAGKRYIMAKPSNCPDWLALFGMGVYISLCLGD